MTMVPEDARHAMADDPFAEMYCSALPWDATVPVALVPDATTDSVHAPADSADCAADVPDERNRSSALPPDAIETTVDVPEHAIVSVAVPEDANVDVADVPEPDKDVPTFSKNVAATAVAAASPTPATKCCDVRRFDGCRRQILATGHPLATSSNISGMPLDVESAATMTYSALSA